MATGPMPQIHATAVGIDGRGVLLTGASGSGKSDLALRLIDNGARLVADDRCDLTIRDGKLLVSCPCEIRNLLEVRGVGIVEVEALESVSVELIAELCPLSGIERMPEQGTNHEFGVAVPVVRIAPFEPSAAAKIRISLDMALKTNGDSSHD